MEVENSQASKKRRAEEEALDQDKPKRSRSDDRQAMEEGHFYSLHSDVLDSIMKSEGIAQEDMSSIIDRIIKSFKWREGNRFSDVDYEKCSNVCGYLFRYGPLGAGLVRYRVIEAARHCPALKAALCQSRKSKVFNMVSLGGGPGNDAFGFCSALAELGFPEDRALHLTVTDAVSQWERCVKEAFGLAKDGDYGNLSRLLRKKGRRLTVDYRRVRLPQDRLGDRCCAISEADLILMTKLLSIVEDYKDKMDIVQEVHSQMKDTALLLFIDSPFDPDLWHAFDILFLSEGGLIYEARERGQEKFGRSVAMSSKARIAVLRKHIHVYHTDSDSE